MTGKTFGLLGVLLSAVVAGSTLDARENDRARSAFVERTAEVPILMYHRIRPLPPDGMVKWIMTFSVHPRAFEEQMRWLEQHGYTAITLAELSDYLRCGDALPPKPVVITFDDGWHDQFQNAVPVLEHLDMRGEFFVCPKLVGTEGYMNWTEVRELADRGMGVEPHSLTHARLTEMGPQAAWHEINDSRLLLEDEINRPTACFAYPFGESTPELTKLVEDAGYVAAVGTDDGEIQRTSEIYALRRIIVSYDTTIEQFAAKLGE
ncbi:MAG TPA: polysaccharide deacetylase family protein [Phycisphaerales bacterium]|nr:polysaccharide deacetylase family protein [Phycisphaerales bacterium]